MDRKSRLPVRSQSSGDIRRCSSLSRPGSSSAFRVRPSGSATKTLSRNQSMTPAGRKLTVPSGSSGMRTKSPLKVKDARPIANPKWQEEQLKRVWQYVQVKEPRITTLKPPSINTFVTVTSLLLSGLDETFSVTEKEYITKIPELLQKLYYPTKIPVTLMKCPYTMHAFPSILAIWSFLLDLLQPPEGISFLTFQNQSEMTNEKIKCVFNNHAKAFLDIQTKKTTDDDISETLMADLCEISKYDPKVAKHLKKKIKEMKKEESALMKDIVVLSSKFEIVENEIKRYETMIMEREKSNAEFLSKCEEHLAHSMQTDAQLDICIKAEEKKLQDLIDKIFEFGVSRAEIDEIVGQLESKKHILQLLQDRYAIYMDTVAKLDLDVAQSKKEVESLVFEINNITKESKLLLISVENRMASKAVFTNLEDQLLPEAGFACADFLQTVQEKLSNDCFEKNLGELERVLACQRAKNKQAQKVCKDVSEKYADLVNQLDMKLNNLELKEQALKVHSQAIDDSLQEIRYLKVELNSVKESAPDLTEFEQYIKKADARLKLLKNNKADQEEKILNFFKKVDKAIAYTECKQIASIKKYSEVMRVKDEDQFRQRQELLIQMKASAEQMKKFRENFEKEHGQ